MKNFFPLAILCSFLLSTTAIYAQNVGINSNGAAPHNSALLDVSSTSKGLLLPRMTEAQRDAISFPATGLIIYQTDGANGLYTFDGSAWITSSGWRLQGNSGTNGNTHFLGTTDAADLTLITNNSERMRIRSFGYVGIGTNNPPHLLSVYSSNAVLGANIHAEVASAGLVKYWMKNSVWSWSVGMNGTVSQPNYSFLIRDETSNNIRLSINTLGRVGINNFSPQGEFELSLDEGRKPGTSTWTIASDQRFKTITGTYTKGLKELLQLQPITYFYKDTAGRTFKQPVLDQEQIGFSAQAVQVVFPEAVGKDDDGFLSLNIHPILIAYVNALRTQQEQADELQQENITLKKRVDDLEKRLEQLER